MNKNVYRNIAFLTILPLCALLITACGSVKVPDEYAYDNYDEYIELANYKGIEYDKSTNQVSQADLQLEIDEMLADSAELKKINSGTVKADSNINMDYVGSIDGVEFDGGSAENVDFDIADNNYIDGFAEGIIGHNVGETFDLHVTFPDDYGNEEFAGKAAVFKVTINYMQEKTTPEYNDDWVKANTDYDSMDAFEKGLKEEMLNNMESSSESQQRNIVFNKIMEKSKILKYPDKEYQLRYDQMTAAYKKYAEANGYNFSDYLSEEMGMTEAEFDKLADSTAKSTIEKELVLHAIANDEGIKITDSEYNDYLDKLLEDAGYTAKSYEDEKGISIEEYAADNNLVTSLLYQKVMDKVMGYAVAR